LLQYGRENIEIAQKVRRNQNGDVEESEDSEGEAEDDSDKPKAADERGDADSNKNSWDKKNGVLISHEVILAVDPEQNYKSDVTDVSNSSVVEFVVGHRPFGWISLPFVLDVSSPSPARHLTLTNLTTKVYQAQPTWLAVCY